GGGEGGGGGVGGGGGWGGGRRGGAGGGSPHRDLRQDGGDVVRRDGLHEGRRQAHRLPLGRELGDAAHELEELRRAGDSVRDLGGLDQSLLGHLRAEVAAGAEALATYDRQGAVVPDAGGRFGGEEVPSRSLEELQHRLVLPRGRVGHVHDDPCACERSGQPLTRDGVDTGGGGGRHNFVPALAKAPHELLADEPAAADHYDL